MMAPEVVFLILV